MAIDRDAFEPKNSDMVITRTLAFAGLLQLAREFIKGHAFLPIAEVGESAPGASE